MLSEKLLKSIADKHSIFNTLCHLEPPKPNHSVQTVCINFPEGEKPYLDYNPDFWEQTNFYTQQFIICHEILHHALNHGERMKPYVGKVPGSVINICLDCTVNQILLDFFDFEREKVTGGCFIEEVFDKQISKNLSFEQYLEEYIKRHPECLDQPEAEVGDHKWIKNDGFQKHLAGLSKFAKETLEAIQAGDSPGGKVKVVEKPKAIIKPKWESIIKTWARRGEEYDLQETWLIEHKRIDGFRLPGTRFMENLSRGKTRAFFFLDTSVSCVKHSQRFINAIASVNPSKFDITLFCFDTRVYKTDLISRKLYGFGGTCFECIEQTCLQDYPDDVFVLTDGYGRKEITVKHPGRWKIMLTEGMHTRCFPNITNFYDLGDFE